MLFKITFDANVSSQARAVINDVAKFFQDQFVDPITINITVKFGSIGTLLGESAANGFSYSYAQILAALKADATSNDDKISVATLPSADPISGTHDWNVTVAEAKAQGLHPPATASDGTITLSNSAKFDYNRADGITAGQYDFWGAVAHEFSEIMGRGLNAIGSAVQTGAGYHTFDLFKYASPNHRTFTGTTPGYFSIDRGVTSLGDFNTRTDGDFGDWANSVGNDASRAFAASGVVNPISEADLRALDAIGYNRAASSEKMYFSDSRGQLFRTDAQTFALTKVGNLTTTLTDLAFAPNGNLYGISFTDLYLVNKTTAALTLVGSLGLQGANALAFDAAGHAFVADDRAPGLYSLNAATGATTKIGNGTFTSDGDLAIRNGRLYLATNQNSIVQIDAQTGNVVSTAPSAIPNLFGMAFSHDTLFGFSATKAYTIDPVTGTSKLYTTFSGSTVGSIFGATTDGFGQTGIVQRGASHNDTLVGANLDDILLGFGGADALSGLLGNDLLDGGAGADRLAGGKGNDQYVVDNTGDLVTEASSDGTDTVLASVSYSLRTGQSVEFLATTDRNAHGAINLTGNNLAQTITGNSGNNVIDGRGGADTMNGLAGNDIYYVDNAGDVVNEAPSRGTDRVLTSVSYTLKAGQSIELFTPTSATGTSAINLTGNEQAQAISGNAGNNVINGKGGHDTLTGLGGHDTFLFDTALNAAANVDRITDFVHGTDRIHLENAVFTALTTPGTLAAGAFFVGAAAHDADDRVIYNPATGALIYDSNGNAAHGAIQFATLAAHLTLTNTDFVVV